MIKQEMAVLGHFRPTQPVVTAGRCLFRPESGLAAGLCINSAVRLVHVPRLAASPLVAFDPAANAIKRRCEPTLGLARHPS